MNLIEQLCQRYTDLTPAEIDRICLMSSSLQSLANLEDADVFIDCPMADSREDAIVVAEAKPAYVPSSYKNTVVGLVARRENEPAVHRTFRLGVPTKQMKAITQENRTVIQTVEPISLGDRVIGVLIVEKRTEDRTAFAAGAEARAKAEAPTEAERGGVFQPDFKRIVDGLPVAMVIVDSNGLVRYKNALAAQLFYDIGFVSNLDGMRYASFRLHPESGRPGEGAAGSEQESEFQIGSRWFNVREVPLDDRGSFAVLYSDITRLQEKERELVLKSTAIQEMHHRVKNNLQTVASLIQLQIRRSEAPALADSLQEIMGRILSISVVHELLMRQVSDTVGVREVLTQIIDHNVRIRPKVGDAVRISLEGDDFVITTDLATTLGLVVNELLGNALRHAFDGRTEGWLRVCVQKCGPDIELQVIDNGKGFDARHPSDRKELGLSLVRTLVRDKLKGTLIIRSGEQGTEITINFAGELYRRPAASERAAAGKESLWKKKF